MRALVISALFVVACSKPDVTTRCGVEIHFPEVSTSLEHWNINVLQRLEDLAIKEFANSPDPRLHNLCEKVRGWSLYTRRGKAFHYPPGRDSDPLVSGLSWCGLSYMEVGSVAPFNGAFVHEIAHVAQECVPVIGVSSKDPHAQWIERGIYTTIDNVRGTVRNEFSNLSSAVDDQG